MGDPFEHDLAQAFLTGQAPRSDLVDAVLVRAGRSRLRRRDVMASGLLAGAAVSVAMVAASGLIGGFPSGAFLAQIVAWAAQPLIPCAVGAILLMAVAGRHLLHDI